MSLTLVGPSDRWFAVGFGSSTMYENFVRLYWTNEAFVGEYDIVLCREGLPASQCVQVNYFSLEDAGHDAQLLHPS